MSFLAVRTCLGATSRPKIEIVAVRLCYFKAGNTLEKVKMHIVIRAWVTSSVRFCCCSTRAVVT